MQFIRSSDNINYMENIIHGANPENLYKAFKIEMPEKIFDFSTNTNILSWPKIKIDVEKLASSYPDINCKKLTKLISQRENINPEKILFTNGINEAIFLLAKIFQNLVAPEKGRCHLMTEGSDIAILQPCYSEYSRAFRNLRSIFNFNDVEKFKAVIICNPNNPTGKYIKKLSDIIKKFPKTFFIIDEAYIDFLINEIPEKLSEFENVILLRSLTKIFHLSGVRIGYVIANEKIISAMKNLQPSWSVDSIAQELALKFLNDKEFYEITKNFYCEQTPKFISNLRASNFEVIDSSVNYFLVKVENDFETIKFLLQHGIVVRHTRNFETLNGKYIRVATRFEDENKFFLEVMKDFRKFFVAYMKK